MKTLAAIIQELWGLFVDDNALAGVLVLWVLAAGFGLDHLPFPPAWDAPILFIGCIGILLADIVVAARNHAKAVRSA